MKDYKVLNKAETEVTVSVGKAVYKLSHLAFGICEDAIRGGRDVKETFSSMSTKITAKSAKVFDAEKAAKEAEKAAKAKALETFEAMLQGWVWSQEIIRLAGQVLTLRTEAKQIDAVPYNVNLEGYTKLAPGKHPGRKEYCFTMCKGIPTLRVGLPDPLPRAMVVEGEIAVALTKFREAAANDVEVPPLLRTENTKKDFDVDEDGKIVYNVKVNVSSGGGGGGKKPVQHIASGIIYESQSAAGKAHPEAVGDVKHPHAKVASLAKQNKVFRYV